MLSKTASGLRESAGLPPAPFSQDIADNIVCESLFRQLRAHRFDGALAILEKHPDLIHAVDENVADAVRYAVFANDTYAIHRLTAYGPDLDRKDRDGWSHMMEAAHLGFSGVLRALIDHGAAMNTKTPLGWTPVQLALMQGHSEAAYVLIMAGANLHDGPMKGMHAPDLIETVTIDPEVVRLVREKAGQVNTGCCGNCQGGGGCREERPHRGLEVVGAGQVHS